MHAASLSPAPDAAVPRQFKFWLKLLSPSCSVQLKPESVETYILPLLVHAAIVVQVELQLTPVHVLNPALAI